LTEAISTHGEANPAISNAAEGGGRVKVLFPLPLAKAYDYLAPADAVVGSWVEAPFGGREAVGVVWPGAPDAVAETKLKSITRVLPARPLAPAVIDFVDWVAGYTMFPLGATLRLVMRSGDALDPPTGVTAFLPTGRDPGRMTDVRKAALAALGDEPLTVKEIAARSGASDGVVRGLVKAGALAPVSIDPDPPFGEPDAERPGFDLSPEQAAAAKELRKTISTPGVTLLDGVTGSGKTEVYLEAAAEALRRDPQAQVLILLPEISLTLPFLKRVEARFGAEPAAWHSDLTAAQRRRVWRRVNEGQARLVIGARSALFLPYRNLSLIIVDEEHEAA
jgi:primosomal protein N' (replication factor Y)